MPYVLKVEAHTVRGVFTGQVHTKPSDDREALARLSDQLQGNALSKLVLFTPTAAGTMREVALRGEVLDSAVLVYEICSVEGLPAQSE